ncbi:hypothetical protein B0J14DRAFT_671782 [Halenospora varia]|nr:hypothetical protein B0J14DRAFT_671782 [Halenospora varia]
MQFPRLAIFAATLLAALVAGDARVVLVNTLVNRAMPGHRPTVVSESTVIPTNTPPKVIKATRFATAVRRANPSPTDIASPLSAGTTKKPAMTKFHLHWALSMRTANLILTGGNGTNSTNGTNPSGSNTQHGWMIKWWQAVLIVIAILIVVGVLAVAGGPAAFGFCLAGFTE